MHSKNSKKHWSRLLSVLLALTLAVSLISPAQTVHATAAPAFSKNAQNILVGDTYQVSIKNRIKGADYQWKSSNKAVAKVNQKGIVTGIKKGTVTINCTIKTKSKSYHLSSKITVRKAADQVQINNKTDYIMIGKTYDLNRTMKPSDANVTTAWSSSDSSVISVDKKGVITAHKAGMAIITARAGKAEDSAMIYAVEQEAGEITKADLSGGKVTLSGKSYGKLTISNSIGNAQVILNNVIVGGTLTMEAGAAYQVTTNECKINKVAAVNSQIKSFALGDGDTPEAMPSLVAGQGSIIVTIDSECNISVKQSSGAVIQSFSVVTRSDGSIQIALEGFRGDLVIDSNSTAPISIEATACEMNSATVLSATEGQPITLTDTNAGTAQASTIGTVSMAANAALKVDVKAEEVVIDKEVSKADVTISQPVSRVSNAGSQTSLVINSAVAQVNSTGEATAVSLGDSARVSSLRVEGAKTNVELKSGAQVTNVTTLADSTKVNVSEGATIEKIAAYGNSAAIEGSGKVAEAIVTGNDTKVNTGGTKVQVAQGTSNVSVNGVEVKEEDKVEIAKPTPTPVPSVTQKPTTTPKPTAPSVTTAPSATPTPPLTPTVPPVINPPANPNPTASPKPSPSPKPTTTPKPSPSPSPTVAPSPTATPTPTVTPVPTDQEKLAAYNQVLQDLHNASATCLENAGQSNRAAVQNALAAVRDKLSSYGNIDPEVASVELQEDYIYDFVDYYEYIVISGTEYGSLIKQYYDSKTAGNATLDQAVQCANRALLLANRIHTEKPVMEADITGLYQSLDQTPEAFYAAIGKFYTDFGDVLKFGAEDAGTLQKLVKMNLLHRDSIRKGYEEVIDHKLPFRLDIWLYNEMGFLCDRAQDLFNNQAEYKALADGVLAVLPEVTTWKWHDDSTGEETFDHVEYTPLDAEGEATLTDALQAVFDQVNLYYYFGSDVADDFTVDPLLAEFFVEDLAYVIGNFDYRDDNIIVSLYDYAHAENYNELDDIEKIQAIGDALHHMIWIPYNGQDWSNWYLEEYRASVEPIIAAAEAGDASELYNKVTALYQKKLREEGTAEEWAGYPQPSADMDEGLLLQLVQQKLEAGSELIDGQPADSWLYIYDNTGEDEKTGRLLDRAVYELKGTVGVCRAAELEGLVDKFLLELPEGRWHENPDDPENPWVEFDMPEDPTALIGAIQGVFDRAALLYLIGNERKDFHVDASYANILADRFANHILRNEDWNQTGGLSAYYKDFFENGAAADIVRKAKVLYNSVDEITGITYDAAGWNEWMLGEYQGYADQTVTAANSGNADSAYGALVDLFTKRLAGGSEEEIADWSQHGIPHMSDSDEIKATYLSILQSWIAENEGSELYRYASGAEAVNAYLVDGVMYNMRGAYWDALSVINDMSGYREHLDNLFEAIEAYNSSENEGDKAVAKVEALNAINDLFDIAGAYYDEAYSGFVAAEDYFYSYIDSINWAMSDENENSRIHQYLNTSAPDEFLLRDTIGEVLGNIYYNHQWNDRVVGSIYQELVDNIIGTVNSTDEDKADLVYGLLHDLYGEVQSDQDYEDFALEWIEPEEALKLAYLEAIQSRLGDNESRLSRYRDASYKTAQPIEDSMHELKDIVKEAYDQSGSFVTEHALVNQLVEAIVIGAPEQVYACLEDIVDYFNSIEEGAGTLLGPEYQFSYLRLLVNWIESSDMENGLYRYVSGYDEFKDGEYADGTTGAAVRDALGSMRYVVSEDGRNEALDWYESRIRDRVHAVLYSPEETDDAARLEALNELIACLGQDARPLVSMYFTGGETDGLLVLPEKQEDYYNVISSHFDDQDTFQYSYHIYMDNGDYENIQEGLLENVYAELVRVIIEVNLQEDLSGSEAGRATASAAGAEADAGTEPEDESGVVPEGETEGVLEEEPETVPDTESEAVPETETEAVPEVKPEEVPESESELESEGEPEAGAEAALEAGPEA